MVDAARAQLAEAWKAFAAKLEQVGLDGTQMLAALLDELVEDFLSLVHRPTWGAQIDRALEAGLEIDYLDYHMLTAVSTPQLRTIVEKLASEYGLGLSRYFGESSVSIWADAPAEIETALERLEAAREPSDTVGGTFR